MNVKISFKPLLKKESVTRGEIFLVPQSELLSFPVVLSSDKVGEDYRIAENNLYVTRATHFILFRELVLRVYASPVSL
jgi:hypothetical protein